MKYIFLISLLLMTIIIVVSMIRHQKADSFDLWSGFTIVVGFLMLGKDMAPSVTLGYMTLALTIGAITTVYCTMPELMNKLVEKYGEGRQVQVAFIIAISMFAFFLTSLTTITLPFIHILS